MQKHRVKKILRANAKTYGPNVKILKATKRLKASKIQKTK
jgi:hypothetical protein